MIQIPGLFHNIGKIHIEILVSFATPGDKFADTALQGDQTQTAHSYTIKFGIILLSARIS